MTSIIDSAQAILAGVIAILVAWWQLGGYLATLRRRLLHELQLLEKLPPGPATDWLERQSRRLTYRYAAFSSGRSILAEVGFVVLASSTLSFYLYLAFELSISPKATGGPRAVFFFTIFVLVLALSATRTFFRRRIRYLRLMRDFEPELLNEDEEERLIRLDKLHRRWRSTASRFFESGRSLLRRIERW